jgi:hypothetical protein
MSRTSSVVLIAFLLTLGTAASYGQDGGIAIAKNINLPKDPAFTEIITALNGLLAKKEKPNNENRFILKDQLLETSALVDEMKGLDKDPSYKPYITNLVKQGEKYAVQFSYIGITDNVPAIKASFTLFAREQGGLFYFYSPLKQNTAAWKTKTSNNITYLYKDALNATDTKEFERMVAFYDKKLKTNSPIIQYYCDDFLEVQQILGLDYRSDYAGVTENILTAKENNQSLIINGWGAQQHRFDPHDLFHERLSTVLSGDITNRPVNEGCAYLYGGSWGFTWPQIITKFNTYVSQTPNADWLTLYTDGTNFNNEAKILKISYVINALIVQKLEKEKGFPAVMELLSCGKKEKGDENYFKALERIAGISKANFNVKVGELIKAAK